MTVGWAWRAAAAASGPEQITLRLVPLLQLVAIILSHGRALRPDGHALKDLGGAECCGGGHCQDRGTAYRSGGASRCNGWFAWLPPTLRTRHDAPPFSYCTAFAGA